MLIYYDIVNLIRQLTIHILKKTKGYKMYENNNCNKCIYRSSLDLKLYCEVEPYRFAGLAKNVTKGALQILFNSMQV